MAIKLTSFVNPARGTISSYLKWHLSRGAKLAGAKALAIARFGRRFVEPINRYAKYWHDAITSAANFRGLKGKSTQRETAIPSRRSNSKINRYTVRFSFTNPKTKRVESRTMEIDLAKWGKKRDIQQTLRNNVIEEILKKYQTRSFGRSKANQAIFRVTVEMVEAI